MYRIVSLTLAFVFFFACSDESTSDCPVGSEGCDCTSGGGCDKDLVCRSNICVDLGDPGDPQNNDKPKASNTDDATIREDSGKQVRDSDDAETDEPNDAGASTEFDADVTDAEIDLTDADEEVADAESDSTHLDARVSDAESDSSNSKDSGPQVDCPYPETSATAYLNEGGEGAPEQISISFSDGALSSIGSADCEPIEVDFTPGTLTDCHQTYDCDGCELALGYRVLEGEVDGYYISPVEFYDEACTTIAGGFYPWELD